jgi:hypothetical protein
MSSTGIQDHLDTQGDEDVVNNSFPGEGEGLPSSEVMKVRMSDEMIMRGVEYEFLSPVCALIISEVPNDQNQRR